MKHFNSPVKYVQILLLFLTYKSIGAPLEERMVVFPLRNSQVTKLPDSGCNKIQLLFVTAKLHSSSEIWVYLKS